MSDRITGGGNLGWKGGADRIIRTALVLRRKSTGVRLGLKERHVTSISAQQMQMGWLSCDRRWVKMGGLRPFAAKGFNAGLAQSTHGRALMIAILKIQSHRSPPGYTTSVQVHCLPHLDPAHH